MNRLAKETSPYLLQHQDNPVHWYPWGDEAFERARLESKPVFLSVGYSSCHWCHVMEHESFEDEEIAALLNRDFISVKVDREERPDVDEAYMTAVHLANGRGGWPMSVFLTPDRKPFLAGTYFPKLGRPGMPGFGDILRGISSAWQMKRDELLQAADEYAEALEDALSRTAPATFGTLDAGSIAQVVGTLANEYDRQHAGFGGAPKFPPHTAIEFLMAFASDPSGNQTMREAALSMAFATLRRMVLGGIHDHVGGGFHRYSTDAEWLVPHFEKMLYDNALMLRNLSRAAQLAADVDERHASLFASAALGIVRWLKREMQAPDGTFYSALDADSEGEEGKYYVWSLAEVSELLRGSAFANVYRLTPEGNFHDEATGRLTGANIPHLREDDDGRFERELELLLEARQKRVPPGLDDKVLVAWNGLLIAGLVEAGDYKAAAACAEGILAAKQTLGELPHQIAKGRPTGPAFADDYACFLWGLLALHEATQEPTWLERAHAILEEMLVRYYDESKGGVFFTSESHERIFGRTKPVFDQPVPSANAVAIRSFLRLGDLRRAKQSLQAFYGWMERAPGSTEALWLAGLEFLRVTPQAKPQAAVEPVGQLTVSMPNRELVSDDGGFARGEVLIEVPQGIHINSSAPPANWLVPTQVVGEGAHAEVEYPPAPGDRYEGTVRIPFRVSLNGRSDLEFGVKVTCQPCSETECMLPVERSFDVVARRG